MNSCSSCGSAIPDGQGVCSMCFGDPSYGSDGYYEEWLRQQDKNEPQEILYETRGDPLKDPEIPF